MRIALYSYSLYHCDIDVFIDICVDIIEVALHWTFVCKLGYWDTVIPLNKEILNKVFDEIRSFGGDIARRYCIADIIFLV